MRGDIDYIHINMPLTHAQMKLIRSAAEGMGIELEHFRRSKPSDGQLTFRDYPWIMKLYAIGKEKS